MKLRNSVKMLVSALLFAAAGFLSPVMAADGPLTGTFTGLNDHITTGQASIVKHGDGWKVVLGDDFSLDGAPDPKVALGNNGKHDPKTILELLRSNTGAQEYLLPAGIDGSKYNEVYIWCEKYSVGLGVASVK